MCASNGGRTARPINVADPSISSDRARAVGAETAYREAHPLGAKPGLQQSQTAADAVANGGSTGADAVKTNLTPNPRGSVRPNQLGSGVSTSATQSGGASNTGRFFFDEKRRKATLGN